METITQKTVLMIVLISSAYLGLAGCSASKTDSQNLAISKLSLGGSSETYEILEQLTEAYSQSTPNIKFKFYPPSRTAGGIRGVEANVLGIGGVSRKLTVEEESQGLIHVPLVEVPLLIAVHQSVTGVANVTAEQIKDIYSGKITNWQEIGGPDADITLLDSTEDANEKQVLRQAYLGKDLKITPEAVVFTEDDELVESVATTANSIAAIPLKKSLSELPINILSIDGIEPSIENTQSRNYAMTLPLGLVLARRTSSDVESFVAFVTGHKGQQVLDEFLEESEVDKE